MKTPLRLPLLVIPLLVLGACNLPSPTPTDSPTNAPTQATSSQAAATDTPATPDDEPTAAPVTPTALSGELLAPLPAGTVTITHIDMIDAQVGWALGGAADPGDRVLRTSDGGSTWHEVTPPQPGAAGQLPMAAFLDADTAFVLFAPADMFEPPLGQPVWFTADGGASWQLVGGIDNAGLRDEIWRPVALEFMDAQHGWYLVNVGSGMSHSYVALFGTTDGGATWQLLVDPFSDDSIQVCTKTDMAFGNEGLGLLGLDCGGVVPATTVALTEDGGHTWTVVELLDAELAAAGFPMDSAYCATDSLNFVPGNVTLTALLRADCRNFEGDTLVEEQFIIRLAGGTDDASLLDYPGGRLQASLMDEAVFAFGPQIYVADREALDFELISNVIWEGQFDVVDGETLFAVARDGDEIALVRWDAEAGGWVILETVVE